MAITYNEAPFHCAFAPRYVFQCVVIIYFCRWITEGDILVEVFQTFSSLCPCLCPSLSLHACTQKLWETLILIMNIYIYYIVIIHTYTCVWIPLIYKEHSLYHCPHFFIIIPFKVKPVFKKLTLSNQEYSLGSQNRAAANWPTGPSVINMRPGPQDHHTPGNQCWQTPADRNKC